MDWCGIYLTRLLATQLTISNDNIQLTVYSHKADSVQQSHRDSSVSYVQSKVYFIVGDSLCTDRRSLRCISSLEIVFVQMDYLQR